MALRGQVGRLLPAIDGAFPTSVTAEVTTFLTEAADARSVRLWLADYEQAVLTELVGHGGVEIGERVPVHRRCGGCPGLQRGGDAQHPRRERLQHCVRPDHPAR